MSKVSRSFGVRNRPCGWQGRFDRLTENPERNLSAIHPPEVTMVNAIRMHSQVRDMLSFMRPPVERCLTMQIAAKYTGAFYRSFIGHARGFLLGRAGLP